MYLKEKIKELDVELKSLKKIQKKFSLVQINYDRWDNARMYTEEANKLADQVDIHHSCGCCSDAALIARPYLMIGDLKLYSDPCSFMIGEGSYHGGDIPFSKWKEKMREKNISEDVIDQIQKYFDEHPDEYEEDEEDE